LLINIRDYFGEGVGGAIMDFGKGFALCGWDYGGIVGGLDSREELVQEFWGGGGRVV
jgi:hypothetical protein